MQAQSRRALSLAAAVLVGALLLVWGPGGVSPAQAFCDSSLCASPEGLAVLADSDAMSGLAGGSVASADGIAASAALEAGVGGIGMNPAAVSGAGGLVGLVGGVAAAVGIKSWQAGSVQVAAGGATGLTADAAPAGWVGSNTVPGRFDCSVGTAHVSATATFTVSGTGSTLTGTATLPTQPNSSCFWYPGTTGYGGAVLNVFSSTGASLGSLVGTTSTGGPVTHTVTFPGTPWTGTMNGNGTPYGGTWYAVGNPSRPADSSAGQGTITRRLTCTDGTTTATQTQAIPVNIAAAGTFAYPELDCPSGMVVKQFGADLTPSTGGTPQTVIPDTATSGDVQAIPSQYPQCLSSACALRLFKQPAVGSPSGTPAADCGDGAAACPDWYTDPARASDYQCEWGPYTVSLDHCSVYRVPGEVLPNSYVAPDGTTTYVAWPPLPSASASASPSPTSGDCWPSGYSAFNPLQWVLMPVRCALSWAFVPSAATSTAWQSFVTDASARPPVNVAVGGVQFTNAVISGLSGSGDCTSLPLQMAGGPMGPSASFDLCAAVQSDGQTTWGQRLRDVLTVVFIGAGCFIAYHRVAASFGGKG